MVNTENVLSQFFSDPKKFELSPVNDGLINTTFKLYHPEYGFYILQKVNHEVFQNPEEVNSNISNLSNYLASVEYRLKRMELVENLEGDYTVKQGSNFWRILKYIKGKSTLISENPETVKNAGKAFGHFTSSLIDFPKGLLKVPILGFIDFQKRYSDFENSILSGIPSRIIDSEDEIEFLKSQKSYLERIITKLKSCPPRIIHADPKLSNILFDNKFINPIAIIDWDTCMAGPILYDFSDMVRSYTNPLPEDSPDFENVKMNTELYQALIDGYIKELESILTQNETDLLHEGAGFITLIQALRFLTDYIHGDIYYKTDYDEHNLNRTRNQIALFKSIQAAM